MRVVALLVLLLSLLHVCAAQNKPQGNRLRRGGRNRAKKTAPATPSTGVGGNGPAGDNALAESKKAAAARSTGSGPNPLPGTAAGPGMNAIGMPRMGGPPGMAGAMGYDGFFCGPKGGGGHDAIRERCGSLPVCRFIRNADFVITSELVAGQGDCVRRCDTRFGLSDDNCGDDEECYSFVRGCPCENLDDPECRPYDV